MLLFRTSNPKRRRSLGFLTSSDEQDSLQRQLEATNWIDEIFNRMLPIPPKYETRFGPVGFPKNPFYALEKRETTFFEFGYGLLKYPSLFDIGMRAVCYEVTFNGKQTPVDVSQEKLAKQILNPKSYVAAQSWVKSLDPLPEAIRYPSVRDPAGGGINFCTYARNAITATKAEIEEVTITPRKDGTVLIQRNNPNLNETIKPIR